MRYTSILPFMTLAALSVSGCESNIGFGSEIKPAENAAVIQDLSERNLLSIQKNPSRAQKTILRSFDKLAKDGVVSRQVVQDQANIRAAQSRGVILQQLLSLDINGDGDISAKEMLASQDSQIMKWQKKSAEYMPYSKADLNDDAVITLTESFKFAQSYTPNLAQGYQSFETQIMAFDRNKDGNVTRDEVIETLESLGAAVPPKSPSKSSRTSKVKAPSKWETPSLRKAMLKKSNDRHSSQKAAPEACIPTPPQKGAEVIFLSGYEGSGLSSVAVTSLDRESEVARLVIEDGNTPLYIVASSFTPLIWSIEGDTKRVAKFVAGRNRHKEGAGVGVVGLPKNKVEFLGRGCLSYFSKTNDSKAIMAKAKWGNLIDHKPDHVFGHYTINALQLPSGRNMSKKERSLTIIANGQKGRDIKVGDTTIHIVDSKKQRKSFGLYRYTIEGLITVDPKTVISPEPVQTYDVFPQQAGLVQLVESGQLEPLERGSFRIVKPIARFPAGLNGGHSVKFILGQGVPLPKGSPGHSSVYSEETGECLTRSCR